MAVPQASVYVCRLCRSCQLYPVLQRARPTPSPTNVLQQRPAHRQQTGLPARCASTNTIRAPEFRTRKPPLPSPTEKRLKPQSRTPLPSKTIPQSSTDFRLSRLRTQVNSIAASQDIPEPSDTLQILDEAYKLANLLVFGSPSAPGEEVSREQESGSHQNTILTDLDESSTPLSAFSPTEGAHSIPKHNTSITSREKTARTICEIVYSLLKDPKVLVDEHILPIYTRIICLLGQPEYLPEIFFLYANKPQPAPGNKDTAGQVRYQIPSPNAIKNAIPQEISDVALDAAILQRDLPLAIAVIDTTVGTSAFRRSKFLRRAALPVSLVGLTPCIVAYAAADWLAQWQNTFDEPMAKTIALAGAAGYIGTLTTIAFVAVTTWNDHHDRVVWQIGTPLRERWLREEERLYFDRIAVAWGFSNKARRGEEMGEEWDALREVLGGRGMVLDKVEFMEGMQ